MSVTKKRVAVIGGGAAGLLCAGMTAKSGCHVTLFEKKSAVGRKIAITGKGRCNVTNDCDRNTFIENVPTNPRFLYAAYSSFSSQDTMAFFEENGVKLKVERGNRVFPESDKAFDIVDALRSFCLKNGVNIIYEKVTNLSVEDGRVTGLKTEKKDYLFDKIVVATGGMSYPLTGSDGDGYRFAKKMGINVIPPKPSLVPLETKEAFVKELMGLSLKNVSVSVFDTKKNKEIFSDFGEMLFTHFGLSGPIILSASCHMKPMEKDRYIISIDLKPALDEKTLDNRLLSEFSKAQNKNFSNVLATLLPQKLIPVFAKMSGIPETKKVNVITKQERQDIIRLLKDLRCTVSSFRPIEEAIVTSGGIDVKEINPKTMESKKVSGLFFAGEVVDVDAYTGGFNLQIAFSTANLAALALSSDD